MIPGHTPPRRFLCLALIVKIAAGCSLPGGDPPAAESTCPSILPATLPPEVPPARPELYYDGCEQLTITPAGVTCALRASSEAPSTLDGAAQLYFSLPDDGPDGWVLKVSDGARASGSTGYIEVDVPPHATRLDLHLSRGSEQIDLRLPITWAPGGEPFDRSSGGACLNWDRYTWSFNGHEEECLAHVRDLANDPGPLDGKALDLLKLLKALERRGHPNIRPADILGILNPLLARAELTPVDASPHAASAEGSGARPFRLNAYALFQRTLLMRSVDEVAAARRRASAFQGMMDRHPEMTLHTYSDDQDYLAILRSQTSQPAQWTGSHCLPLQAAAGVPHGCGRRANATAWVMYLAALSGMDAAECVPTVLACQYEILFDSPLDLIAESVPFADQALAGAEECTEDSALWDAETPPTYLITAAAVELTWGSGERAQALLSRASEVAGGPEQLGPENQAWWFHLAIDLALRQGEAESARALITQQQGAQKSDPLLALMHEPVAWAQQQLFESRLLLLEGDRIAAATLARRAFNDLGQGAAGLFAEYRRPLSEARRDAVELVLRARGGCEAATSAEMDLVRLHRVEQAWSLRQSLLQTSSPAAASPMPAGTPFPASTDELTPPAPGEVLLTWLEMDEGWCALGQRQVSSAAAPEFRARLVSHTLPRPGRADAMGPFFDAHRDWLAVAQHVRLLPTGGLLHHDIELAGTLFTGGAREHGSRPTITYQLDLKSSEGQGEVERIGLSVFDVTGELSTQPDKMDTLAGHICDRGIEALRGPLVSHREEFASWLSGLDLAYVVVHGRAGLDRLIAPTSVPPGWPQAPPAFGGELLVGHQQTFSAADVLALERAPSIVVLASCETSQPGSTSANDLSIAQAFLIRGADVVIAYPDNVEEQDSDKFMKAFWRQLLASEVVDVEAVVAAYQGAMLVYVRNREDAPEGAKRRVLPQVWTR